MLDDSLVVEVVLALEDVDSALDPVEVVEPVVPVVVVVCDSAHGQLQLDWLFVVVTEVLVAVACSDSVVVAAGCESVVAVLALQPPRSTKLDATIKARNIFSPFCFLVDFFNILV